MTARTTLYTPAVLAAATGLAAWPWNDTHPHVGQARSRTCGSTLTMGLALNADGTISAIGIRAHACAIGQASANAFATGAIGQTHAQIATARTHLGAWLAGESDLDPLLPQWPGLADIAHARAITTRHGAIALAWDAALDALEAPPTNPVIPADAGTQTGRQTPTSRLDAQPGFPRPRE